MLERRAQTELKQHGYLVVLRLLELQSMQRKEHRREFRQRAAGAVVVVPRIALALRGHQRTDREQVHLQRYLTPLIQPLIQRKGRQMVFAMRQDCWPLIV